MATITRVRVPKYVDVYVDGTPVTLYPIEVMVESGAVRRVSKRYSDVLTFHKDVLTGAPHPALEAFNFPHKSIFHTTAEFTKERRRSGFEEYFELLLRLGPAYAPFIATFLKDDDDDLDSSFDELGGGDGRSVAGSSAGARTATTLPPGGGGGGGGSDAGFAPPSHYPTTTRDDDDHRAVLADHLVHRRHRRSLAGVADDARTTAASQGGGGSSNIPTSVSGSALSETGFFVDSAQETDATNGGAVSPFSEASEPVGAPDVSALNGGRPRPPRPLAGVRPPPVASSSTGQHIVSSSSASEAARDALALTRPATPWHWVGHFYVPVAATAFAYARLLTLLDGLRAADWDSGAAWLAVATCPLVLAVLLALLAPLCDDADDDAAARSAPASPARPRAATAAAAQADAHLQHAR